MKKIGWEKRLVTYLHSVRNASHAPGELDCALFFGDAVRAMTGDDTVNSWRGKYKTLERGKAMLRKKGFADHVAYVDSIFPQHDSVLFAQRGDGAVVEDADGNVALGIVQGEYVYVMTLTGLGLVKLTDAKKAYKI